ncbi:acyl-CoA dehydrogenase family protein [Glutamicibacter halophytocola]|uniref:acyl-CoA dehydrogenase family protein n=1 Tax=Glutamicibacter halophytocola TaxID=1933880 RepID=UPI00155883D7|nr:acyl-CoA dehydrogenase family protein [Glutamicibacter halophytocola]NQD42245.1 acyl-CoA/acyl-ACP dehydrogenase [Glutamicibacter halophytocola]
MADAKPVSVLSSSIEEFAKLSQLRSKVRQLLSEIATADRLKHFDEIEEYDVEMYREIGRAGLINLGCYIDGPGPSHAEQAVVLEELGAGPTSVGVSMVVQYMGMQLLHSHANAEQRKEFLAPLHSGEAKMSFGLSEPGGGTDVARAMRTSAKKLEDGSYSISGQKKWIGGAMDADYIILLARTTPIERSAIDGITMFLVPRSTPGIHTEEIDTMGIRGLAQCDVYLDDVRVPSENILGEADKGFRQVISTLNGERLNGAAVALGIARGALECAVSWAKEREAFGRQIGSFQALQHSLVDASVKVESARLLLQKAASASDAGPTTNQTWSAMAKLAASDAATTTTDAGMRVMAGWGFSRALPMQRYFRDARLYTFAPLTDEMIRNNIGEKHLGLPRSF